MCLLCLLTLFSTQYDIVGHSGDGYDIELVTADKIPKNNKQRLKVLKVYSCFVLLTQLDCKKCFACISFSLTSVFT